jgi:hypothetical protein
MRVAAALVSLVLTGCGGTVDGVESGKGGPSGTGGMGPSPSAGAGGTGAGVGDVDGGGWWATGGNGAEGGGPYRDPGCPDVPPTEAVWECDPLADDSGCLPGLRCVPFVQYAADECQNEVFGTTCVTAGEAGQGDDCSDVPCAAQHVCVTTGQGNQCVRLCSLSERECDPGLLCLPLDVDGFYVCF